VLAALDLAEPTPSWPAVLDRLKAAAGESNLGRARAALVYALVRSGDITGAKGAALLFTIYKGTNKLVTLKTTAPKASLVDAARKAAAG